MFVVQFTLINEDPPVIRRMRAEEAPCNESPLRAGAKPVVGTGRPKAFAEGCPERALQHRPQITEAGLDHRGARRPAIAGGERDRLRFRLRLRKLRYDLIRRTDRKRLNPLP